MSTNGTRAGHVGWNLDGDGVVLVDVCGTLDDTGSDQHAGHEAALLGGSDVAVLAWHLGGDGGLGTGGEGTSSGGVNNGGVWAAIC